MHRHLNTNKSHKLEHIYIWNPMTTRLIMYDSPVKRPERRGGRGESYVCRLGEELEEKAVYIRWLQYGSNWTDMLLQHNNCIQKYSVLSIKRISLLDYRFYLTYFSDGVT